LAVIAKSFVSELDRIRLIRMRLKYSSENPMSSTSDLIGCDLYRSRTAKA
jgi:hypothetical protein